ncbi:MAG TPA: OmpA family protein [Bacteroidales bacterium]|nr:OmpA family protein [Bacteroidales bacterium]
MKIKIYHIAICLTILLGFQMQMFAQQPVVINKKEFKQSSNGYKDAMSSIKIADAYYIMGQPGAYRMALKEYLKAYEYNQYNAELNYKIGACYLYSTEKPKAIDFLQKAYKAKPGVAADIHYLLGWALHLNYEFDEAIKYYRMFQVEQGDSDSKKSKGKGDVVFYDVDKRIRECETGKKLVASPIRVFIDNLGSSVNSKYPDYGPVITTDQSVVIFTSRREGSTGEQIDPNDLLYYEDLYVAYFDDTKKEWSQAINMRSLNTDGHDASVGLSPDGQILYTYKGVPDGTIFESVLKGDNWSKPKEMNNNINTKLQETSASISYDGKFLYFISDRPKDGQGNSSVGGKDIFICEKQKNGNWGPSKVLGAPINTKYDEEGVFMHPDGVTMYFCSKRDGSMGGYDIFYSESDGAGNWSEPINIGYPVNTPDDDVFFVVAGNARYAYYSSAREGGYGLQDLYRITFLGPEKMMVMGTEDILIASSTATIQQKVEQEVVEVKKVRLTIMKGTVTDALSGLPVEATIEIIDNEKNELITTLTSNSKTGKYLVSLPSGKNYGIAVKADGYLFYSENINIPEATAYQEVTKDIVLSKVGIGSKIVLKNIFFDYGKETLRETSYPELDRLVTLLESYPNMTIEIGGHTDNHGSLKLNTDLSEARAKSVVDYLLSKGVSASRLSYKGYAYSQPIATNDTEEGRQQNRRVEFKVVSIK